MTHPHGIVKPYRGSTTRHHHQSSRNVLPQAFQSSCWKEGKRGRIWWGCPCKNQLNGSLVSVKPEMLESFLCRQQIESHVEMAPAESCTATVYYSCQRHCMTAIRKGGKDFGSKIFKASLYASSCSCHEQKKCEKLLENTTWENWTELASWIGLRTQESSGQDNQSGHVSRELLACELPLVYWWLDWVIVNVYSTY